MIGIGLAIALELTFATVGRAGELAFAAERAWPKHLVRDADVSGGAMPHVLAAMAVETKAFPAERLLAIARLESGFRPDDTSRIGADGERHTGRWGKAKGRGWRGPYFCGPLQAKAKSWARCLELRDLAEGYRAGAAELAVWMRRRDVRGKADKAMAGHGCGNDGLRTGCKKYARRVRRNERILSRARARVVTLREHHDRPYPPSDRDS